MNGNQRLARVYRWDKIEADHPMALIDRRRLVGEHVMLSHVKLHKGFNLPSHHHANEQYAVVLSGRVRFHTAPVGQAANRGNPDAAEQVLTGGDVIYFPANVPHAAEAIEDTLIIDVFSPPSEKTGVDQE